MAMKRGMALPGFLALFALFMASGTEQARSMDGVLDLNLGVQQVSFTPARAHVGDTIQITVRVANLGDSGANKTIPVQILANGKRVADQLFSWGDPGITNFTVQFQWNTAGAAPGEYGIKADFSFFEDSSPFDNYMAVKQPLILVPAGAPFPAGQPAGGTATETDPQAKKWWDK
jgi:hypothetical protein